MYDFHIASSGSLYRLMAWLSPSYPVGAFSYSGGIEWAVEAGDIADAPALQEWIAASLAEGAGFCDAVLFACAYRAVIDGDNAALAAAAELAAALVPSRERQLETLAQGRAFATTTSAVWPCPALDTLAATWPDEIAYPIAVAVASAGHHVPLAMALGAYLQSVAANAISAGVRLIPLGQTDGQRVLAALLPTIQQVGDRARTATLDDIGSATFRADIASMRHEAQYTRLFRS